MLSNHKMEEILSLSDLEKTQAALKEREQFLEPQLCMLCTGGKKVESATFQCLTCEVTYLCGPCKEKHIKAQKRQKHKVVPYELVKVVEEGTVQVKIDEQQCPVHLQKYRLYCFTDEKPLCLKCTEKRDPNSSL
jgi:hypothetical protein